MTPEVTIIDYGAGNLFSVSRAIEQCGARPVVTDSAEAVMNAERLLLPGVGAFEDGMEGLRRTNLIDAIKTFARTGRPFLGICLGMQMMLDVSEEFGMFEGLGLIPGRVVPIPSTSLDGKNHKIPHIGWNRLVTPAHSSDWDKTILKGVPPGSFVYFVHSYTIFPSVDCYRLADCYYNGRLISAVIRFENLYGCQFHPEKSGTVGLQIIRNFLSLSAEVIPTGTKSLRYE